MAQIILNLPEWVSSFINNQSTSFVSIKDRMQLVINLSHQNVINKTGGPFGAAIFELHSGKLISVGVNLVVSSNCCIAHAEIIAIILAQKKLSTFDLGGNNSNSYELVSSSQMCSMCLGCVIWSGVERIIYGASTKNVQQITGFDEGPIAPDWKNQLKKRGIGVIENVLEDEACAALKNYIKLDGIVYNSRRVKLAKIR